MNLDVNPVILKGLLALNYYRNINDTEKQNKLAIIKFRKDVEPFFKTQLHGTKKIDLISLLCRLLIGDFLSLKHFRLDTQWLVPKEQGAK